jgi:uncharacterized protein YcfL
MKHMILLTTLLLTACSSAQDAAFTNSIVTLTKAGCHLTVNLAANAGAVNPGSGVQFQGSADCPSTLGVLGNNRPMAELPGGEHAAPTATFLK